MPPSKNLTVHQTSETHFQLGQSLAKRLLPLVVIIACLMGFIFPVTVYVLDYRSLTKEAHSYSKRIAHELEEIAIDSPTLWKYQIYRFAHLTQQVVVDKDISLIKICDETNSEVVSYRYESSEAAAAWNRWAPHGAASVIYNNKVIGTVRVGLSQKHLLIKTALTAVVSGFLGLLLAFLAYTFPTRIVRRMDQEVQTLIDDLENSFNESGQLRIAAQESEKRFLELVQGLDAIIWEGDPVSGRYCFVSHQAERLLGLPVESWCLADNFFIDQVHPVDRERVAGAYHTAISQEVPGQIEYRRFGKDGTVVWLRDTFRIVPNGREEKKRWWGVIVDITPRVKAEEALMAANEKLSSTVRELRRSNREISVLREMGNLFQLCNSLDEACEVIAATSEKLFPAASGALFLFNESDNLLKKIISWGNLFNEHHSPVFLADNCLALRSGKVRVTSPVTGSRCCEDMSEIRSGACVCIPLVAQGNILGVYRHYYEKQIDHADAKPNQQLLLAMTEHMALAVANMQLLETLHVQALHDPLTSLFNRRYADEAMVREIAHAERKKYSLGIMMIDIDNFKKFNDTYGHDAGDLLLVKAGNVMTAFFREYDRVCRYGGEEFVCIIPDMNFETIFHRAEQLRQLIKDIRISHFGTPLGEVTISVGIAMYPQHGRTKSKLLKSADAALYLAKDAGRDRVMAEGYEEGQVTIWN
ncbi:GGDEF domain-containing protein [Pelotalea chapellei]|uniref:diguanylate cyclase n=1 Tax=Pelotalea chapellei TaxID=44671 RepID=A0ABS5U3Q5_9BACT|nr:sensor domain-containing diguanylate cyclase [Pelotalea chapellei]MBT1070303.1 diguanylate cyclase [Pelotalea chapellei]